jgi:uncharacterized membrane protein
MMKIRIISGLFLILLSLILIFPSAVFAQEGKLELTTPSTKLAATSGSSFEFEIALNYTGTEARVFNIVATGPQGWTTYVTPSYPKDQRILDIRLEPAQPGEAYGPKIDVYTAPPYSPLPGPGEYPITLELSSGDIVGTINLTAVVTAKYDWTLITPDGLLSTKATAGKDNYFAVVMNNTGTAPIDNITFNVNKPSGWTVLLTPDKLDSMPAGASKTIEVNIKPPANAIAGDYGLLISAEAMQRSVDINIRVTVETPTIWGWVGVIIILLVIVGVAFVFMRFSRR